MSFNLTHLQKRSRRAGDCNNHDDCNNDSLCVQNPSQALGQCLGDPQGEDIKAANENRPLWNNGFDIDYCIPACPVLLERVRQGEHAFLQQKHKISNC